MGFEKNGFGTHTHYGTRTVGGVSGTDVASGLHRTFAWVYSADNLLNDRYFIPNESSIFQVEMTGAGAVTVGGTAIASATTTAPVVAHGEVEWTGAKDGDKLVIYFTHMAA